MAAKALTTVIQEVKWEPTSPDLLTDIDQPDYYAG